MHLIKRNMGNVQPFQAGGEGIGNRLSAETPGEGKKFGCNLYGFIGLLLELSDQSFRFAQAVHFSRIEEVYTGIQGGMKGFAHLINTVIIAVAPKKFVAPGPGANAEGCNSGTIFTEIYRLHASASWLCRLHNFKCSAGLPENAQRCQG